MRLQRALLRWTIANPMDLWWRGAAVYRWRWNSFAQFWCFDWRNFEITPKIIPSKLLDSSAQLNDRPACLALASNPLRNRKSREPCPRQHHQLSAISEWPHHDWIESNWKFNCRAAFFMLRVFFSPCAGDVARFASLPLEPTVWALI